MGMYTEFHFNSELKEDVPESVLAVLRYMLPSDNEQPEPPLPDHPFFKCERWRMLLTMDSYYFDADTHSTLRLDHDESYYLCVRSNLKNYDNEINRFVDWITPYLDKFGGEFLGFKRYEEIEVPTLLYHPNTWVEVSVPNGVLYPDSTTHRPR